MVIDKKSPIRLTRYCAIFLKLVYGRRVCERRFILAVIGDFPDMEKPKIDEQLTLLTEFGKIEAICAEVLESPVASGGVLLKVMARGPFEEGQQCWIIDRDGSKIGATVEIVFKQTIDSEVTLSTVLPA